MPLKVAFVPGGDTKRQAIGDLSRDCLWNAGGWAATVVALGGFGQRVCSDATKLHGSDFDTPSTDFNRVHVDSQKEKPPSRRLRVV